MYEWGIQIYNIEAASIYEYNHHFRERLDLKRGVLANSLLLDFLLENNLNVIGKGYTKDVICVEFNYGSKCFERKLNEVKKRLKDSSLTDQERVILEEQKIQLEEQDNLYNRSRAELRYDFYENGLSIEWKTHDSTGNVINKETIRYKMLYRSAGKAKAGKVMAIREELYDKTHEFLWMGIELPKENAPIVEIGAYSSLIASGAVGRINIQPENVLILKDVESDFYRNVVCVNIDDEHHCYVEHKDNYKVTNVLFDGEALVDDSIFPEWADGFILLRHHFFKAAAFHSYIQQYFKDYYGDQYQTATVKDMFGNDHYVKDIQVITTDNACKWLKFNKSYEYWCEWVHKNNNTFSIVKTAHKSKYGNVQRMSYQMTNTLDIDRMDSIMAVTEQYVYDLKNNEETFLNYLKDNSNFSNDYEVLVDLVNHNHDFIDSDYFKSRKNNIIKSYINLVKTGKLIQDAENLTMVGNPYGLLMYSIGLNPEDDPTLPQEEGTISCYTERFNDNEYLAIMRSPYNSANNLGYLHNHYDDRLKKYFNLGKCCVAINNIHTDIQSRMNGCDYDSDSGYTTAQPDIVDRARRAYYEFPTIINNIPKEKNKYNNSMKSFADVDIALGSSQRGIGESSNLAQIAQSYSYSFPKEEKYKDICCILSIVAQAAIDNAKRKFSIDIMGEIRRIRKELDIETHKLPLFWMKIKQYNDLRQISNEKLKSEKRSIQLEERNLLKDPRRIIAIKHQYNEDKSKLSDTDIKLWESVKYDPELISPMNCLFNMKFAREQQKTSPIPFEEFLVDDKFRNVGDRFKASKKVEALIVKYSLKIKNEFESNDSEDSLLLRQDFDDLIEDIKSVYLSRNYKVLMLWLIKRGFNVDREHRHCDNSLLDKNKSLLLKTLWTINKPLFLQCFKETR